RGGIGLRGYGQRDPLVEYKNEAYTMFEQLISGIDDEIVHRIYKIQVQNAPHVHSPLRNDVSNVSKVPNVSKGKPKTPFDTSDASKSFDTSRVSDSSKKKLGRNDPCHCGSGKKYKKCHLNSDLAR
ncbi:MAG: SEC-C metal-binding domain-containing protein, partial [bacterium]|nr:SEC-C metal-binding domain-containing protein [bacterium]